MSEKVEIDQAVYDQLIASDLMKNAVITAAFV